MSIPAPESWDLWHSAVLAYQDWKRRRAALNEVNALGRYEAEKVLGECGLTCDDFDIAMRHPFASTALLPEAIRAVGADPDAFEARHPEWNRDMRRSCMMCSQRRHCSDQLAAASFATGYRDFCPNRDSIGELTKLYGNEAHA
jgi:hypothetical protein